MNNTSSDKRKIQTEDRSNNFDRGARDASSSRSKGSDSRSTSSQLSYTQSFQLPVQSILPLIDKIKNQNDFMQQQKRKIEQQMQKLSSFSELLMQQNQALRRHYYQRNVDLQQLIQSIKTNEKLNTQDINHQIYLYRQHNMMLIKYIQNLNKDKNLYDINIEKLQRQLKLITMQNFNRQNNSRNAQVKIKQLANKTKMPQKNLALLQNLQKQVCDLCLDVNILKKRNIKSVKFLKQKRAQIQYDKPTMKYQTVQTIKGAKNLRNQIQQIQVDSTREQNKNKQLMNRNENLIAQLKQLQSQNQKKRLKLGIISQKIQRAQQNIYKSLQQHPKLIAKKQQKLFIKNNLQKQAQKHKQKLHKLAQTFQLNKRMLQASNSDKIQNLKQQMQRYGKDNRNQISKIIVAQKNEQDSKISNLKYELSMLDLRTEELQNVVTNLRNLQKNREIMNMQMKLQMRPIK